MNNGKFGDVLKVFNLQNNLELLYKLEVLGYNSILDKETSNCAEMNDTNVAQIIT